MLCGVMAGTVVAEDNREVLTPKPGPEPRINGAKVFGVRPGNPCLYTIAATGERPMEFSVKGLPRGLKLDKDTGRVTGLLNKAGEYTMVLSAKNGKGIAHREFKIVVGGRIALTPPMGWNSWNCFASAVTEGKVRAAAKAMGECGLVNHGWQYINVDDFWQVHRDSKDETLQGPRRGPDGRILPNPRFPDMAGLTEYIHGLGLKAGLYSSPGPWTCGGCVGSYGHEAQDARQYAGWGFDYLKYDWCSYGRTDDKTYGDPPTWDLRYLEHPYVLMGNFIRSQKRDMVFSLCQYGWGNVWEWGGSVGGNCWRTTGDITDTWDSMAGIGFSQAGHEKFAKPGNWNDPDMLVVGKVGWDAQVRPSRLTADEQYTHISLWCLLAAPLLIGCDMTQLDEFTLGLLTNDEVLEVDQDPLGRQAARVTQEGALEVWAKDMEDGSKAVGLVNRGGAKAVVTARWKDLGISGPQKVRDLWRQKEMGVFSDDYHAEIPSHGCVLVRLRP